MPVKFMLQWIMYYRALEALPHCTEYHTVARRVEHLLPSGMEPQGRHVLSYSLLLCIVDGHLIFNHTLVSGYLPIKTVFW